MKTCSKCNIEKPLSEFRKDSQGRNGKINIYYRPECKDCEKKLREQYNKAKKNATSKPDRCACCKKITDDLVIDHDHETGKFRGWLCRRCNIALGKFNDDIPTLKNAIKYLKGGSFFSKIFGGK